MKYVSLDIETSGLDPTKHSILQISMIVEDTELSSIPVEELPHFTAIIRHTSITGTPYALSLNSWLLDQMNTARDSTKLQYPVLDNSTWVTEAALFLSKHFPGNQRIVVAGKNVAGFDLKFLPETISSRFMHRTIDPTMYYIDYTTDANPPDLQTCLLRAGYNHKVSHDAYGDAKDIIMLLRNYYVRNNE